MEVAVMGQGQSIRLDRFLAEMKQGTRSQVKEMIRKGRVLVDGTVCQQSLTGKYFRRNPGYTGHSWVGKQTRNIIALNKTAGRRFQTEEPRQDRHSTLLMVLC